jgi:hypothetical protein
VKGFYNDFLWSHELDSHPFFAIRDWLFELEIPGTLHYLISQFAQFPSNRNVLAAKAHHVEYEVKILGCARALEDKLHRLRARNDKVISR